jgi:hypothetical protein
MIDERSKAYSYAGDDRVNQAITGKVRVRIQKEIISDLMRKNEEIRGKRLGQL